jgi:glycosyltransferase involved in cell wall biosynthesis
MIRRCDLKFSYHKGLVSPELIRRLFERQSYDLIHVHIPFPLGLEAAVIAAQYHGIPVVVTHHGTGPKDDRLYTVVASAYDRLQRGFSLARTAQIVFLTDSYRDEMALSPRLASRVRIVRTGADIDMFSPNVDGTAVRKQYGLGQAECVGLWVGSLNEHNRYKGLDYLLEALATTDARDIRFLIVGGGELLSELQAKATRLGLGQRVKFTGPVSNENLPEYYAAANFFTLPSIKGPENSPVVVFEAMASGKPVIASDLPGVREIVRAGQTGLLVPPRDIGSLANALRFIRENVDLCASFGQQGRELAAIHSWSNCAAEMETVYSRALSATERAFSRKRTSVRED